MNNKYIINIIPGDGIGKEVVPVSLQVLDKLSDKFDFELKYKFFDYSCDYYLKHGEMMDNDGMRKLADCDAILLGAVGMPNVPDHISLWGLLIPIRRAFDQYVNLRPVKSLKGVNGVLKENKNIDYLIVRENSEGEYSDLGGVMYPGTENEIVIQHSVFSKKGTERIVKYAFEIAHERKKILTSATKSNGIIHSMTYWDNIFENISKQNPKVETSKFHIDILCAQVVKNPDWFDVIVASNLFGDILSDLGPVCTGGMGIAPSANLNPERKFPSMFEPVHGSAPDIYGKNIANPIATIWSCVMMLEHLGEKEAAAHLFACIEKITESNKTTSDLGGSLTTTQVGEAIIELL
jgi:tartrate dehydrogenase/decarboxylase/D-malate dehydrogenase